MEDGIATAKNDFEGRFQDDDITSIDTLGGLTFNTVTESFQPRVAVTYVLNDNWTVFGQYAQGTNPAGVNLVFTEPDVVASLAAANAAGFISYDDTTFIAYTEEELTNIEVGIKGAALDGRLQLAASLYVMDWDDLIEQVNIGWNGPWNVPEVFEETMSGMIFINSGTADLKGIEGEAT